MGKFRKKPVVIEAFQFTGANALRVISWAQERGSGSTVYLGDPGELSIDTLEGKHTGSSGDWIIRGVNGEFYPCKPDIFEATYEAVEGGTDGD